MGPEAAAKQLDLQRLFVNIELQGFFLETP